MTKPIKMAIFSDIHLGNSRNKAKKIIEALDAAFPDNEETGELDFVFLAGDVFDRELTFPNEDVVDIQLWADRLLRICAKRNIILRVLEGTPSHDWKQSVCFENILKLTHYPVNFKYVSQLSIEHVDKFGINILYIPDEWGITAQDTLNQVHKLLEVNNLTQVDYGIFHGQFDYQATWENKDATKDTISHDSEKYLSIVKHYIFIGHIHTHSSNDRIVAQGSFDRLGHGQEEPKGHVRAVIDNDDRKFFFVENKQARVYKTIDCKNMELQETLEYIKKKVDKLPEMSCVRIMAEPLHCIFTNMNLLIQMYPTVIWSKVVKVKKEKKQLLLEKPKHEAAITISKENVSMLIKNRMIKSNTDSGQIDLSMQLLDRLL